MQLLNTCPCLIQRHLCLLKHLMLKFILACLSSFMLTASFAQPQKTITIYLLSQYNNTIYDATKGNNPWGIGLGLQTFFNNKTKFKPTIELTSDVYLLDDKVFRTYADGTEIVDVRSMVNLFAGVSFHPVDKTYLSFVAGPSFISGYTLLGIKPSFDFFFSKNKRWTGKVSYINIFNREKRTKEDFSSLSLAIGVKLF